MACNARVCTPKAQLGLPELQLGVIPGFGGTQRLPRLVGLPKALEMIMKSKPVKAEEALKLGLVDQVVPAQSLLAAAMALAGDIAAKRAPRVMAFYRSDKIPDDESSKRIIAGARRQAKRVKSVMPHPWLCLDAIEAGLVKGAEEGLKVERVSFDKAVSSAACKGLVHFFFASRQTATVPGVTDVGLTPRKTATVGVVGGGLMGSGIATACVMNGVAVVLKEINQKFLDAGMGRVRANLASAVKKGRLTQARADAMFALCRPALTYDDFGKVDMAIEAVIENVELKQKIFADLEAACRPDAILSTNTSTIDITKCAAKMRAPERIVGAHFFSPAHVMQLFEIIRTEHTPPQVLCDTLGLSKQIKKTPVVVGNCTGFAVNRVFFPYTMSACLLLDLGCDPYAIDGAIKMFGMPMGPFRLNDLVGTDIGVHVGKNFVEDFPDRVYESKIIPSLMEANRLGEKSGAGLLRVRRQATREPRPGGNRAVFSGVPRGGGAYVAFVTRAASRDDAERHSGDDLLPGGERSVSVLGGGRRRQSRRPRRRGGAGHGLPRLPRGGRALGRPGGGAAHRRQAQGVEHALRRDLQPVPVPRGLRRAEPQTRRRAAPRAGQVQAVTFEWAIDV
jgi:enoyl-CoA hydratase/3-hydroxyacyl-CoA dehydrogenase